jgi:hypothetical protein
MAGRVRLAGLRAASDTDDAGGLVRLLDGVALARHACPTERWDYDDEEHGPLPARSYDEWRRVIGPRFPDFGFYWDVLNPFDPARAKNAGLGDAIDDLADIAHDLQQAVRRCR